MTQELKITRILEGPRFKKTRHCTFKEYLCDDGKWHSHRFLSDYAGLTQSAFSSRLARFPLTSPEIFAEKSERALRAENRGNEQLLSLSGRSRYNNLKKLPPHGTWESKHLKGSSRI